MDIILKPELEKLILAKVNSGKYTTVDEVIPFYVEKIRNPDFTPQLLKVIRLGFPLTTIANSMQMASVMEGKHNIDVGMLVIPLIMEMLMLIAENADIEYDDGLSDDVDREQTSDSRLDEVRREMKERIEEVEDEEPETEEANEEPKGLMARRA